MKKQTKKVKGKTRYLVNGVWTEKCPKDFSTVEAVEESRRLKLASSQQQKAVSYSSKFRYPGRFGMYKDY